MAPEIRRHLAYDGELSDIFSAGVILFILAQGIYPFKEASETDPYYSLLYEGRSHEYWKKVEGEHLSEELKNLIQ